MFQLLDAVSLGREKFHSGTTNPLQIDAMDDNGNIEKYVVKIFSSSDIEQNDSCFKEFFCHEIIKYFDLHTPDVALIQFNDDFLNANKSIANRIINSGSKLHFGSKYGDYVLFPGQIRDNELDLFDMENILAVDALMFNVDRRVEKPNFLVSSNDYTLIDHEKTFGLLNLATDIRNSRFDMYYKSHFNQHIFKSLLKKNLKHNEINYGYFSYFLDTLELRKLSKTVTTFDHYEIPYKSLSLVEGQISAIKENKTDFIDFLKNFIR